MWRAKLRLVPVLVLFAMCAVIGSRAVDFGEHRDEPTLLDSITESIRTDLLLPRWYNYPSVCYAMALGSVVPEVVPFAVGKIGGSSLHIREELLGFSQSERFRLRVRAVFLVVTLLSIVWTYLLALAWRRKWPEALLAAALLAFSWEVACHARWVAPDGILMQFAILCVLLCFAAIRHEKGRFWWLRLAAVAAGLACGTKYPGGIMLLPLLLTYRYLCVGDAPYPRPRHEWVRLVAIFGITFVVSTPGAVCEPLKFIGDVLFEMRHYALRGHGAYTVKPVVEHAPLWAAYFSLAVLSHYWPIALLFFGLALVGAYSLVREDRRLAVIFLCVPVLYTLYFWTQKVMVVRNYMILVPFLALLSARGVAHLIGLCPAKPLRACVSCAVAVLVAVNASWVIRTSNSVHNRRSADHGPAVAEFIRSHPAETFYPWPGVMRLNDASTWQAMPNVVDDPAKADKWLFTRDEVPVWQAMAANRWRYYQVVAGSMHVNIDYYPSWVEGATVIALPPGKARMIGLDAPPRSAG